MVCGQTHPQNKRPNAAVKSTMNTMNVIIARPNMKKSCGQNILPKMINLASGMLNWNKGLPFTCMNGNEKNSAKKPQLTHVRTLKKGPFGFCTNSHFLFPFASTVTSLSRNDSVAADGFFILLSSIVWPIHNLTITPLSSLFAQRCLLLVLRYYYYLLCILLPAVLLHLGD